MRVRAFLAMVLASVSAISSAAVITVTLDQPNPTVARPTTGTTVVSFSGTVTIQSGYNRGGTFIFYPYIAGGGASDYLLTSSFSDAFFAWDFSTGPFSGKLFEAYVTPEAKLGLYNQNSNGDVAKIGIAAFPSGGTGDIWGEANYSVNVVPEPATLLALGIGALTLARRRRPR